MVKDTHDREISGKLELLKGEADAQSGMFVPPPGCDRQRRRPSAQWHASRPGLQRAGRSAAQGAHPCCQFGVCSRQAPRSLLWPDPAGVSFYAAPGDLTALMGGSGAGKASAS